MINRERVEQFITFLETKVPPEQFNLLHWATGDLVKDCGTIGCVAGWSVVCFHDLGMELNRYFVPFIIVDDEHLLGEEALAYVLGLTAEQAEELCYYTGYHVEGGKVTIPHVVAKLRRFLEKSTTV